MTADKKAHAIVMANVWEGDQEDGFRDFVSSTEELKDAIATAIREARSGAFREAAEIVRDSVRWDGSVDCEKTAAAIEARVASDRLEPTGG